MLGTKENWVIGEREGHLDGAEFVLGDRSYENLEFGVGEHPMECLSQILVFEPEK